MTVDSMYSVAVTSKFKLFYDEFEEDEDPSDMLSRLEAEAKERTKTKVDKNEKKKNMKDGQKKPENKEVAANRTEKPADKKAKRPEKKDERPPRFANRQTREESGSGQRENREFVPREGSGPPRGRGGFRGDRGGFRGDRGSFRGERGGGYRGRGGMRDNNAPRPNGTAPEDEWSTPAGTENKEESWTTPQTGETTDGERRSDDRGYKGGRGGQTFGRGSSGGFRGNRGTGYRGRGEGRGTYRNTGREYERHSGSYKTGVKPVDKRDGAGAHNWGTMKDDMDASAPETNDTSMNVDWVAKEGASTETAPATDIADDAAAPAGQAPEEGGEGAPAGTEEAEAPAVQMTLDEYRAQQAKRKAELAEALKTSKEDASRKINDGQDAFKNMVRYQKERLVDDDEDEEEEEEDEDEEDPHKSNKILIDVRFADAPRRGGGRFTGERGRGSRGGAGGERGSRGGFRGSRGGYRGGYEQRGPNQFSGDRSGPQPAQIRLNDENDFPSLK